MTSKLATKNISWILLTLTLSGSSLSPCLFFSLSTIHYPLSTIYLITTIAGDGTSGYSGDGTLATTAQLNKPWGLVLDSNNNLYVADSQNHCIRKIDTQGIITTVAGNGNSGYSGDGGPATAAKLNQPAGVALDHLGNLYIADTHNQVLRKVTPKGVITTIAGNNTPGYRGDGGPAGIAQFHQPTQLAIDEADNLYIADTNNHVIRKIDSHGIITTVAGNNTPGYSGDHGPAIAAQLQQPQDVSLDQQGNLYIADSNNHLIRKIDLSGNITTVAGNNTQGYSGDGKIATAAQLDWPASVAIARSGNLYLSDTHNYRIRQVNTTGHITTVTGNGTLGYSGNKEVATVAQVSQVFKVIVDNTGNLYISDTNNHRLRKLTSSPKTKE
jgi:sugar lactone lactonase YvrE